MLFNSIEFAIFLPLVFLVHWLLAPNSSRVQNLVLLISSGVFYGWWDPRLLGLLVGSILFNYQCAIWIDDASNPVVRRRLLWLVALVDFGLLGFFKYFNFFQESLVSAFTLFGSSLESHSLDIILPVGISFYTFIAFGYVADVHQRKTKATRNLATFATFVSFFPQVLAGPIERSHGLLPQLFVSRKFDPAIGIDGLRQILWGLFKKVAIANTAAEYANQVFDAPAGASGSTIAVGAIFYSIQIYCDFSGYSDIALGTARLFGIELVKNFDFPYFSRDIAEFWRRWHISLNSWFRDYIYIPLGGSRGGVTTKIRNTFAIFLVSGLWHGANWTFIVWGALNAAYFLPLLLGKKHRSNMDVVAQGRLLPSIGELARMGATMFLTAIAWIVFRSANLHDAWTALSALFSPTLLSLPTISGLKGALIATALSVILFGIEWLGRENAYGIQKFLINRPKVFRISFYYALVFAIFWFSGKSQQFIYFQF